MQQPQRDGRVAGMRDAPLPFDEQDLVVLVGENLFFDGPAEEIRDHAVDRAAVPFDHDAGLAGGDEFRFTPSALRALDNSSATSILPTLQSWPTVWTRRHSSRHVEPRCHVVLVILANIESWHPWAAAAAENSASSAEKFVQARDDVHAATDGSQNDLPPSGGNTAPGRGDAQRQGVGRRSLGEAGDDRGCYPRRRVIAGGLAGLGRVQAGRPPIPGDSGPRRWRSWR